MKRGLGRGLASLISKHPEHQSASVDESSNRFRVVRVEDITVGEQPRKRFDEESLRELAESIRSVGLIQPLTVVRESTGYKLLAGERRLRAAKMAGLTEVPVIVLEGVSETNRRAIQLIENLQRMDLTPIEEASGYHALIQDHKLTHEQIAALVGKSRAHVTNMLRLLTLEESVKELISQGFLTVGHAKVLVPLSHVAQRSLAKKVISENLSVRALEEKVKQLSALEKGVMPRLASDGKLSNSSSNRFKGQAGATEGLDTPTDLDSRLRRLETLHNCKAELKDRTLKIKFASVKDILRVLGQLGC